jgi:DNA (cytosine-5)-methyltransferase 1
VGLAGILAQVENEGYEVRVFSIPACAVGAPQRRERYWIVCRRLDDSASGTMWTDCDDIGKANREINASDNSGSFGNGQLAHTHEEGRQGPETEPGPDGLRAEYCESHMENATGGGSGTRGTTGEGFGRSIAQHGDNQGDMADSGNVGCPERPDISGTERSALGRAEPGFDSEHSNFWSNSVWLPCADGKVRRAPDDSFGLVDGLHRSVLGALGNSIVPQVAERIIEAMIESEKWEAKQKGTKP